jgi:hypothetical protein
MGLVAVPVRPNKGIVVELPTIQVNASTIIKARAVKEGEIAHVRFDYLDDRDRRKTEYHVVPAAHAQKWREIGTQHHPRLIHPGLTKPDPEKIGAMAAVRIRFGLQETINLFVPRDLARKWEATTIKFGRLYADYQRMLQGGV